MEVAQIGCQEDGGVTRTPFTKEEKEVKELAVRFMKEAGLFVYEDAVGNLIGRKEGRNPKYPSVLIGSHLDTVYNGGNFDGVQGVLGGIEVLQSMDENGVETEHPVEVIAFTNEETTRFPNAMIGNRGVIGKLKADDLQQRDKQGITMAEAMRQAGYDPNAISKAIREKGSIKAYLEMHIEQGRILENKGLSVGFVDGIYSQLGDKFILEGEAGHAGTTPMNMRKDTLMAASESMLEIEKEARRAGCVATIGQLHGGIALIS
jgi:hydantoinase/carbamoylase family amidase